MQASLRLLLVYALLCTLMTGIIMHLNHGAFTYAIDDPYIHLAMAENLPDHLGVNLKEVTDSSSSILYPWLLVPVADTVWAPLVLNITAGALVLLLLSRLFGLMNLGTGWRRDGLVWLGALSLNLFSLIFIGLEHTLHLAATLTLLLGLIEFCQNRKLPVWFWLAFAVAPLLRYEALALDMLILLWLGWERQWRLVVLGLALLLPPQLLHGLYLHSLGLPWLPTSVLQKSVTLSQEFGNPGTWHLVRNVLLTLAKNILSSGGPLLVALIAANAYIATQTQGRERLLALTAILMVTAHLLLGHVGWFDRYHIYALGFAGMTALYLLRDRLLHDVSVRTTAQVLTMFAIILSFIWQAAIPRAAHQVWLQPVQVHTFLTEFWKDRILAIDIGAISWKNPHMVADIIGLGSEPARQILTHEPDYARAVDTIAKRYGTDLVLTTPQYPGFNPPATWEPLAALQFDQQPIILQRDLIFFLTNPARKAEALQKLEEWGKTLPEGILLTYAKGRITSPSGR